MSSINPEHLNYFKFIGRIMGLAIYHRQYLSVNFTILFYKKLLNKSLEFSDMKFIDPEIYKNINWLRYETKFNLIIIIYIIYIKKIVFIFYFYFIFIFFYFILFFFILFYFYFILFLFYFILFYFYI